MKNIRFRALAVIAFTVPLCACGSLLSHKLARYSPKAPAVATQMTAPATEAGRKYLADGQPGLAIEAFQKALGSGEAIAPAANGMGVAYARLGRYDLAERFFQQAMAADPSDLRYAENITRLVRSAEFALRRNAESIPAPSPVVPALASAVPRPGAIERLSRNEVRISTVAPQAPPLRGRTALPAPVPTVVDSRFKPLVRIAFDSPTRADGKAETYCSNLQRISRAEVRIATAPTSAPASRGKTVIVDNRFRPLVRIALREEKPLP